MYKMCYAFLNKYTVHIYQCDIEIEEHPIYSNTTYTMHISVLLGEIF